MREYKRSGPQTVGWVKAKFEHTPEPLCAELEQVRPVQLDWVEAGSDPARRVAFYLDRYHYLGWHVVGQNIGYLARDSSGRDLAVLLFGAAAWRCAPRDRYLDWSESERLDWTSPDSQQQSVFDFAARAGTACSQSSAGFGGAANQCGLATKIRTRLGLAGELCGGGTFSRHLLSGRQLAMCWPNARSSRYDRDRTLSVPPKAVYLYRL